MKWFSSPAALRSEIYESLAFAPAVPVVSVITPTFNERENIGVLADAVGRSLLGIEWELVVVDDNSPDETYAVARELSHREPRVRCIRRLGRRGLAGAVIEGFLSSSADYVAVIDADMQHDEKLLPQMLRVLQQGKYDVAVASRYADGACNKGLDSWRRTNLSLLARILARRVLGAELTDPTSGFFMMRRDVFEAVAPELSVRGFKILVDILASSEKNLRVVELPFKFRMRHAGTSKLNVKTKIDYVALLLKLFRRKLLRQFVPPRAAPHA